MAINDIPLMERCIRKAEACYSARIISSLIFQMGHNINRMTVCPLQASSFRSGLCLSMSTYCRPQVSDIYHVGLSKSSQSRSQVITQEFHNQTCEKVLIGYAPLQHQKHIQELLYLAQID